jgi:hypothetical protein
MEYDCACACPAATLYFLNMLQQVLSQLAIYSTNTVNINLVECGDNEANVSTVKLLKVAKLVAHYFEQIENHILDGSYPDTVSVLPQGMPIQTIKSQV